MRNRRERVGRGPARPIVFLATRSGVANGASLNAARLAAAFREAGHRAEAWSFYSTDGAPTLGFDRCFANEPPRSPIGLARVLAEAARAIVRERPSAVFGFHPLANVWGLSVARLAGTTLRIASQRNPAASQRPVLRALDRIAGSSGLYSRNVCVSPAVARTYARYPVRYRRRLTVIWNGVPDRRSPLGKPEARIRLGLPVAVPLVGTVGRLDPQKNQSVLIDAVAAVPGVHLVIAGDGGLRDRLIAQSAAAGVASRVHFLGNLPGDQVPGLLAAIDAFAFPSVYEGFGLALVEAMQAALPCLVSDIEIFRDIVRADAGDSVALLVGPEKTSEWARAIAEVVGRPDVASGLGERARERADAFRFEVMAAGYLALLDAAADAPSGRAASDPYGRR